jgi:hypothetical protein
MKTEFLIIEQDQSNIDEHMFGFCSKCMTVYRENKFSKLGCLTCRKNLHFKGKYSFVIFNIKSLFAEFFDKNESFRNMHYLRTIEETLQKVAENNIFCRYEQKNLCFYFKCNEFNIEKNIKTAWKIYRKFKITFLKSKINKLPSDIFKINFMNRLTGKEKDLVFSFPEIHRHKINNPAVLPHIHLSREIFERNFRNNLNL